MSFFTVYLNKTKNYFTKGHERSVKAKKNIIVSFGLKGVSVFITFLLVPLTLNYIDVTGYGIWLTLSSVLGWLNFFDIGLGNGLRNKFAEATAKNQNELARSYLSTTYAAFLIIIGGVYLLFLFINPLLNWTKILNTPSAMENGLSKLVLIVFTFFCLKFILQLIGTILTADQKPAITASFDVISGFFSLIIIFILTKTTNGSLLYLGTALSVTPVIVLLIASFIFYNKDYKYCKPSYRYVDFRYFKDLVGLGVKFFILQIAFIIIFSTDNIIITQIFGPSEVTPYNLAFKYFGIPIMIFSIIITPFWSAFTEAYAKNDISWIKSSMKKLIKIWVLFVAGVVFLLVVSNYFYLMWVGNKVIIPYLLSAFMGLFAIISTWNSIFANFINGVGKIKLQMYYAVFAMIINIPVSILFAKTLNMGSAGVILGTCVSIFVGSVFAPIQSIKILKGNAEGIWNR